MNDIKICEMVGVREYAEQWPVDLYRDENGRLTIRAINEGGHNCTCVDLVDLINWLARAETKPIIDAALSENLA